MHRAHTCTLQGIALVGAQHSTGLVPNAESAVEEGSVMFTIVSRNCTLHIVDDKQLYLVLGRESMRVRAFVFVCGGVRSQIDEDVVCSL